ncbi:FAM83 family protein [Halosquirtibacter laminarini]|uniref:FAM83 family protein n=1 Tax=Halosquirtibacter laminarini TaxID=3374600 RepID=A0AC61NKW7_9BACT|nr:FAM83 family protein [Prolixibacteraceae bacterium]
MEPIKQEVLNNHQIYEAITTALQGATTEILVVTAWFTDPMLLEHLMDRAQNGVRIGVVISEDEENKRLDFSKLTSLGASIYRIGSRGNKRGMMHQKFCVVDKSVAIHGSYNWTVNARKNNEESAILTNHRETIDSLIANYHQIIDNKDTMGLKNLLHRKEAKKQKKENAEQKTPIVMNSKSDKTQSLSHADRLESILDNLLESEFSNFDKDRMKALGYQNSKEKSGDHEVLQNILDTLYADFAGELNIAHEKKQNMILRIQEEVQKQMTGIEAKRDAEIREANIACETERSDYDRNINEFNTQIENEELKKKGLVDGIMKRLQNQKSDLLKAIDDLQVSFAKTKLNWSKLGPSILFMIIMFVYLIVFYSSAGYILIFGKQDAEFAKNTNALGTYLPPEVFDPQAITHVLEKGATGVMFVFLFVFVPLVLSIIDLFLERSTQRWKRYTKFGLKWFGILFIDAIIAYKVAATIHETTYLKSGLGDPLFHLKDCFTSVDFYLVFALGSFGLVLFSSLFKYIIKCFSERNEDEVRAENKIKERQFRSEIKRADECLMKEEKRLIAVEQEINQIKQKREVLLKKIDSIPMVFENKKNAVLRLADQKSEEVSYIKSLYLSKLENNNLKFSFSMLTNRVNTFMNGWTAFLHSEFSVAKAEQKSKEAMALKDTWLLNNQNR